MAAFLVFIYWPLVPGRGARLADRKPVAGAGKLCKRPAGRMQRLYQLRAFRMQTDGEGAERRLKPGADRLEKALLAGPETEKIRKAYLWSACISTDI